jgi:hypothetical protein
MKYFRIILVIIAICAIGYLLFPKFSRFSPGLFNLKDKPYSCICLGKYWEEDGRSTDGSLVGYCVGIVYQCKLD